MDLDPTLEIHGTRGRRRCSPERKLPRRGFAGAGRSRLSGLGSGLGLAWQHERGMRNPLLLIVRCCGMRRGARSGGGGSAQQSSPACARTSVSGLGSGQDRVSEGVWCKGRPERGLPRFYCAVARSPWRSGTTCGGGAPSCGALAPRTRYGRK